MTHIHVKSPTRVDLAGGTLDLWPICSILGGASTINMAISIFSEVELGERNDSRITVELQDIGFRKVYESLAELLNDQDPAVAMIRVQAEYFKPAKGFGIKTRSESPVGGGLGGSSSLCIGLIQAFTKWLGISLRVDQTVELAHNLEAQVLGLPTGTQDYFPALLGGLCVIDYAQSGPQVQKLPINAQYFADRSFLVYTGRPHHSGLNNWDVLKKFIEKDAHVISCLKAIRRKAVKTREMVVNGEFDGLKEIFQESYQLRTKLSPVFTSPEIERLKEVTMSSGGHAVKICGAGGGGCVMVWTSPENKGKVLTACQSAGFQILNAQPVEQGSQIRVD